MLPPTRILAGVDFSESSANALAYAAGLSHLFHAELHVLHVVDPMMNLAAEEQGADLIGETLEALETLGATVPMLPVSTRYHAAVGLPSDTIIDIADREETDLIVTGSRGIAMAERIIFGSTTEALLRLSHTSVLVVPHSMASAAPLQRVAIDSIVAGLECTGGAADAADAARRMAAALGADLRFVHAIPDIATAPRWSAQAAATLGRRCLAASRDLHTLLSGFSIEPERLAIRVGPVVQVLADATANDPGALLVLGRCYGAPGHPGAASIARRLLMLTSVPVLMYVSPA